MQNVNSFRRDKNFFEAAGIGRRLYLPDTVLELRKNYRLSFVAVGILWAISWTTVVGQVATTRSSTNPATTRAVATSAPASTRPMPTTRHVKRQEKRPAVPKHTFELNEVATHAEAASITLRSIGTVVHGNNDAQRVSDDLPILTAEIDARLDETNKLLASSPSLQLLGAQERDWTSIRDELKDWQRIMDRQQGVLQLQEKEVLGEPDDPKSLSYIWDQEADLLDYWTRYGSSHEIVDSARDPIEKTLKLIESTNEELRAIDVKTRTLGAQVNVQTARVEDVLIAVRQSRDEAFSRMFKRNAPPLWSFSLYSADQGGLVQQGQDSFIRQVQAVAAYIRQRWENIGAHLAVLLLMIFGLYMIRRQINIWTKLDPSLQHPTRVFCLPIATALALSLLISIWIYPQAPRLFWAVVGAAALAPTVVILRRLIDPLLFPVLNALMVFYFLDQVRSIAAVVPIAARLVLLVEVACAALLLMSFIRSSKNTQTRIWDLIRVVSWAWTVLFILAFVGDMLGFVSLANLLGDAALGSAYLAVILYAGAVIVSGLVFVSVRSRPLTLLRMVKENQPLVLSRLTRLVTLSAVLAWFCGVLASLSLLSAVYGLGQKILSAHLDYGAVHLSLKQVVEFVFTVWLSFQVSRFLRFVLEEDIYDRFSLPSGIPFAISRMLHYVVLLIGFYIALSTLNDNDLSTLNVLAGAFGVGLAFGTQNIVNNFVSGLILLFERPVKVGDVIQMDDTTGVVGHIGIRASVIRTMDSAEIIVPNGMLISGKVTNWTLSNRQRGIQIQLALGSTAEPKHVMELLVSVAAANSMVSKVPAPQAFLTKFGGDAFNYELHAWTNNAERWIQIRSDLSVALNAALVKEAIAIK